MVRASHNLSLFDRAGITSFTIPNASDIVGSLRENDIIVAKRGEGVRVSLHYYNNHNDIDKFIEVLNKIRKN